MKEGGPSTFHPHPSPHIGIVRSGSSKRSRSGSQPARPCLKHPTGTVYHLGPVKRNLYCLFCQGGKQDSERGRDFPGVTER